MAKKRSEMPLELRLAQAARDAFNPDGWNADEAYEAGWLRGREELRVALAAPAPRAHEENTRG